VNKINLADLNLKELKGLQSEIEKQLKERQQQEINKAREQILAISQSVGVTLEELLTNKKVKSDAGRGKKVQPRYQNPADNSQTWTGRGRKPKWMSDELARGKTMEEFKI
jgi:DNA-binding protein H-NS